MSDTHKHRNILDLVLNFNYTYFSNLTQILTNWFGFFFQFDKRSRSTPRLHTRHYSKVPNFLLGARGGQKAEFGFRGGGLRMFFAETESKNFVCWQRRSGSGDRYFSNFLCKVQTYCCFQIFTENLVDLHHIYALLTQHYRAFLCSNVCFRTSYALQ